MCSRNSNMGSADMSAEAVCGKLAEMESALLEKRNEVSLEEASTFHNRLISLYKEFTKYSQGSFVYGCTYSEKHCNMAYFVQKKVFQVEKILLRFFSPDYTISSTITASDAKMTDERQLATFSDLASLIHKQKYYMKMIDLLEPKGDLKVIEAGIQSEHLNQYHKKFISNQSEITALIDDTSSPFNEQVELSLKVQEKVCQYQAKLKQISMSPTLSDSNPKVNDQHATPILTWLIQSQQFYIKMIDSLEPTGDFKPKHAEFLSKLLNNYHDKFISIQCQITALLKDTSSPVNDQVAVSLEVQQKVREMQAKFKEMSSIKTTPPPAPSTSFSVNEHSNETNSVPNEHFNQATRPRVAVDSLEFQLKRQKKLILEIKLIESKVETGTVEAGTRTLHLLNRLLQFNDALGKNHVKITASVRGAVLEEQLQTYGEIVHKVKILETKLQEMTASIMSPYVDFSYGGAYDKCAKFSSGRANKKLKSSDSIHHFRRKAFQH